MGYLGDTSDDSREPFLDQDGSSNEKELPSRPPRKSSSGSPGLSKRTLTVLCVVLIIAVILLGLDRTARPTSSLYSSRPKRKEAIATLWTDASWVPHLSVVTYGIDIHSPNRDKIVIIPDTLASNATHFPEGSIQTITEKLGWKIARLPYIDLPSKPGKDVAYPRYADVMNKLHIWNMTDYDGIAFFDLDGLVVGNLDTPFELLAVSNVSLASVPDQGHGYDDARAAPQAGSMWIRPDREVFEYLYEYRTHTDRYDLAFPEQNMLNRAFWGQWLILPAQYGLQENYGYRKDFARIREKASFLHYTALTKPWLLQVWSGKVVMGDKRLWMDTLKNATQTYQLSAHDLTQGASALEWDVLGESGAV